MEIFQNPWIVCCILVMPVVIILLTKAMHKLKNKSCANTTTKEP